MPRIPVAARLAPRRVTELETRVRELQRIGPQPWVYVGTYPTDPFTRFESPAFQNSLANNPGTRARFRWGMDGSLDMVADFDLTAGYVSGAVGFNVNENTDEYEGEGFVEKIPIELEAGVWTFGVARLEPVDRLTYLAGDFHIDWPIVADPIP